MWGVGGWGRGVGGVGVLEFNNLGLLLAVTLTFYTSVEKELKLKVRKFCGLSSTFVEVTREKLVRTFLFLYIDRLIPTWRKVCL